MTADSRVAGDYKGSLNNLNTFEAAKQRSRDILGNEF